MKDWAEVPLPPFHPSKPKLRLYYANESSPSVSHARSNFANDTVVVDGYIAK